MERAHFAVALDSPVAGSIDHVVNQALELMGARTLQRMAAENDVRGHNTAAAKAWFESVKEQGLKETLLERDRKFGDGRARVNGPEIRDEVGRLVQDDSD